MRTFEIYRNGTHHATIKAKNKREAKQEYASQVGHYNFNLYEIKTFELIYLDKNNNELLTESIEADNLQEAKQYAKDILSNSMINDLHKIKVIKTI